MKQLSFKPTPPHHTSNTHDFSASNVKQNVMEWWLMQTIPNRIRIGWESEIFRCTAGISCIFTAIYVKSRKDSFFSSLFCISRLHVNEMASSLYWFDLFVRMLFRRVFSAQIFFRVCIAPAFFITPNKCIRYYNWINRFSEIYYVWCFDVLASSLPFFQLALFSLCHRISFGFIHRIVWP